MIDIRRVEAFDKASFAAVAGRIFGDGPRQRHLDDLIGPDAAAGQAALCAALPKPERLRVGAFDGEQLVGYSHGWFEVGGRFYIGSSAVREDHRGRGVYTRLMQALEQAVRERGGLAISSQHVATNHAVLIAKLKLGYVIAGTEYVEPMGLLVRLVLHLHPAHRALFAERTGMLAPPAA
jgi:ribosomal protein S18 acetylase RimI-like enzyme